MADPAGLAQIADALSQPGAVGRLSQVCHRWIYTACLCFALDSDQQQRCGFGYELSVYQVEHSRNLIFASGAVMQRLFEGIVDRTRARLDVPRLRSVFGAYARPHRDRVAPSHTEAAIETPAYNPTIFTLHFGRLTAKAYTKGERVLRLETIVHNTAELRCGRVLDNFADIVARPAGMAERLCTALDCVDVGFITDGILDEPPQACQLGATRIGGADVNNPRTRNSLPAALALAAAPAGFTVAELTAKVHAITGQTANDYTARQAARHPRKHRGKHPADKPGRTRRHHTPDQAARTTTALLTLRDQVTAPILAGVRSPHTGPKPKLWTAADRDHKQIRITMQTLFSHLDIALAA